METNNKLQKSSKKLVQALMGAIVVAGIISFIMFTKTDTDGALISKLFLVFFGFIITVQIIPGLVLFGAMLKGVSSFGRKEDVRNKYQ